MNGSQRFFRRMRSGPVLLVTVLSVVLLLTGCSSKTYREVTPESPVIGAVDQYGVHNGGETYRITPGDTLRLSFFYNMDLNQEVIVRPDGRVSLLLVDDVEAAGLTPEELDHALTEEYAAYFKNPEVTVAVARIAEARIYVGGEVRNPAMMGLHGRMTAMQAIIRAGGFARTAKVKEVLLVRKTREGEREIYELNLRETMNMESSLDDIYLQAADLIIVPPKAIAKVNQFVDEWITGIIPLRFDVSFRYLYGKNYYQNIDVTE